VFRTTKSCGFHVVWVFVFFGVVWNNEQSTIEDGNTMAVQWNSAVLVQCINTMSAEDMEGSAAAGLLGLASIDANNNTSVSADAESGSAPRPDPPWLLRLLLLLWKPKKKKESVH